MSALAPRMSLSPSAFRARPRSAAAARSAALPRALPSPSAVRLTPLSRRHAPGARASGRTRSGVVVASASETAYERLSRTWSSYELSHNAIPNGYVEFIKSMALPFALVTVLAAGVAYPDLGIAAKEAGAVQWATVTVFLLTGLSLRLADVRAALNAKRAALYGLVSCLGLSALLAPAILAHGPEALPMLHHEFFAGLALLCCVPTTLSTGVILARQADANDALVLLLMLLTNVIGVATLPFALAHIFGAAVGAAIEPLVMLQGLALTVLAPLLAGIVAQTMIPGVSKLVDKARAYMRLAQQACLIATPWMTISESQHQLVHIDAETLAIVAGAAFALHLTLLFGNAAASAILGLGGRGRGSRRTRRALLLAASQKTLPVSVVALSQLGNTLGEPGLVLLPCIFFHLIQIVFGSMLVAVWRSVDEERL